MTLLALLVAVTSCGKDAIPTAPAGPEQNRLVAQVIVQPGDALLAPDDTRQLSVVVKSARGQVVNGRSVTWRSLDESVALVDHNGTLFAANEGSAKVRATVEGVSGTATIDVRGQVVDVVFDEVPSELDEGEASKLNAIYVYSNGATRPAGRLQWTTRDRSVAAVDGEGLVLGTGDGTATIEASGRGISAARSFKVKKVPIKSVVVSAPKTDLTVGDSELFWAEVYGPANKRLTRVVAWASSNTSVATVDSNGLVSAVGAGQTTITASVEGVTGSLSVRVSTPGGSGGSGGSGGGTVTPPPGMVTDLTVTFPELGWANLRFTEVDDGTGQAANYEVRYFDQDMQGRWGEAFTVTSGSCTAPVVGTGPGQTLRCMVGGLHASTSYEFQVVAYRGTLGQGAVFGSLSNIAGATTSSPSVNVDVVPTSFTLDVGQARQLQASVLDAYGNTVEGSVTWTSSSSAVATVSSDGNTSGVSSGNATIRATYQASTSGTSSATVVQPSTGGEGGSSGGSSGGGSLGGGTGGGTPGNSVQPGANEPAGLTKIAELSFDDPTWQTPLNEGWAMLSPTTYSNCGAGDGTGDGICIDPETVSDGLFPNSPVGLHTLPQNFANNSLWAGTAGRSGGTRVRYDKARVKEIYVSFRHRFDPNWNAGHLKILGLTGEHGGQWMWVMVTGPNPNKGNMGFWIDQKELGCANSGCTQPHINHPRATYNGSLTPGAVHFIEVYAKFNSTGGARDGVVKVWVDGVLRINQSDVVFALDNQFPGQHFAGALWDPIPGSRTAAPEVWLHMDDIYVSGR